MQLDSLLGFIIRSSVKITACTGWWHITELSTAIKKWYKKAEVGKLKRIRLEIPPPPIVPVAW